MYCVCVKFSCSKYGKINFSHVLKRKVGEWLNILQNNLGQKKFVQKFLELIFKKTNKLSNSFKLYNNLKSFGTLQNYILKLGITFFILPILHAKRQGVNNFWEVVFKTRKYEFLKGFFEGKFLLRHRCWNLRTILCKNFIPYIFRVYYIYISIIYTPNFLPHSTIFSLYRFESTLTCILAWY